MTLPLKSLFNGVVVSWNSLKNYSKARLFSRSPNRNTGSDNTTDSVPKEQLELPEVSNGNGAMNSLRTFIRTAYRSAITTSAQQTTNREMQTFATLDSVDGEQDYHNQLKAIYSMNGGSRTGSESVPASRSGLSTGMLRTLKVQNTTTGSTHGRPTA